MIFLRKQLLILFFSSFFLVSCSDDDEPITDEDGIENPDNDGDDDDNDDENPVVLSITDEILKLVNEHRTSIDKSTMERSSLADELAEDHTRYMIEISDLNHDNLNDRGQQLVREVGARSWAENVAVGQQSAKQVMDSWLNSLGHKRNIEGDYTHIGIAAIKNDNGSYYYTQLFYR